MTKSLVSIIVPVYNVEKYLSECLESLVNQTYPNIEIICINDGSTDSSLEILEQFAKRFSKIKVVSIENQGLSVARNLGLSYAAGDFITFVDSDDWLDVTALESIHNDGFLDDPEIDIICFGIRKVVKQDSLPYRNYSFNRSCSINNSWVLSHGIEAWGKLYRKQFLYDNQIKFPVGLYYEDITFYWTSISRAPGIATSQHVFYNYRIREDSIMGASIKKKARMAIHHLYNLEKIHQFWSRNSFLNQHTQLFDYIFELYVLQGYKYLLKEDTVDFINKLKELVETLNLKPKRFSLTYDLIHNKKIRPFKYRWAKSLRKKRLMKNR